METILRFETVYGTLQIIETSGNVKIPSKGDGYIFDGKRLEVTDVSYEYSNDNVVVMVKVVE